MSAKHTPGPWTVDNCNAGAYRFIKREGECVGYAYGSSAQSEANAKLIAAAPEMAQALRMICDSGVALADPIEKAMLAALAKAGL
jgi:hypothetical protein